MLSNVYINKIHARRSLKDSSHCTNSWDTTSNEKIQKSFVCTICYLHIDFVFITNLYMCTCHKSLHAHDVHTYKHAHNFLGPLSYSKIT